jgi:3-methyladenine DNA glycosylase AlkD
MDSWAADFDSWDVCDQCCGNLFNRTPFAYQKALEWSEHKQEFIKRAAFSLMACLAVHDKKAPDSQFEAFLPVLLRESGDERNYVKKAVNWALRQIGKRSRYLNERAIEIAEEMKRIDSKVTRWIASDALRELSSSKVQAKLLIRR